MSKVKVKAIRGKKPEQIAEKYGDQLKSVIFRAANLVQNNAKLSIQNGVKSGAITKKYNPTRIHQASAAGEAPATDTGNLVNNIAVTFDEDGFGANVESNAEYSAALEFGTTTMAARPFMHPAKEEARPAVQRMLQDIG